jgi:hypothetical protein
MSKPGRKPRDRGERFPSGKLRREPPPVMVRRLRDAALAGLRDPEWGTELGRLYLEGTITATMYAAGKAWRDKAARYVRAINSFGVRSPVLEQGRAGSPPDPDSETGREQARREANDMERFFEAHAILLSAGRLAEATVRRLCEHDEGPCGHAELIALRNGLSALAER